MSNYKEHLLYDKLRAKHPTFIFENYTLTEVSSQLNIKYHFNLNNDFHFYPEISFPIKDKILFKKLSQAVLNNIIFHIGMVELVSYWKSACSPKVIIKPYSLTQEQKIWWKKLYFNGLGEFFFLNKISAEFDSFMQIECMSDNKLFSSQLNLSEEIIVPIGGGKDSIVSLEILKDAYHTHPLVLNTNIARSETIRLSGIDKKHIITINRSIHPQLIELNKNGYLNGHTPFSALLAFTSILAAFTQGIKHIALSNESSANESTVPGTNINHQYSKSFEFEEDFRSYISNYISPDFNYFSFLRAVNELQIGRLFSQFEHHFKTFRSCNVGSKSNKWCAKCSKCLFTYIILAPFICEEKLIEIFGHNLLNDLDLIKVFDELIGKTPIKPFECVGTYKDVKIALQLIINQSNVKEQALLLNHYLQYNDERIDDFEIFNYLSTLNNNTNIENHFLNTLKSFMNA